MDGEVVGYFLHFLLQLPSLGRIVFPVKLIGKPLDPTHRDFVLGLMEEAVEEVRELLRPSYIPRPNHLRSCARTLIAIL